MGAVSTTPLPFSRGLSKGRSRHVDRYGGRASQVATVVGERTCCSPVQSAVVASIACTLSSPDGTWEHLPLHYRAVLESQAGYLRGDGVYHCHRALPSCSTQLCYLRFWQEQSRVGNGGSAIRSTAGIVAEEHAFN